MTSARHTPPTAPLLPFANESHPLRPTDPADAGWPAALRALLLLSGAAAPGDPLLARASDDDLGALRGSLARMQSDEPTSAA